MIRWTQFSAKIAVKLSESFVIQQDEIPEMLCYFTIFIRWSIYTELLTLLAFFLFSPYLIIDNNCKTTIHAITEYIWLLLRLIYKGQMNYHENINFSFFLCYTTSYKYISMIFYWYTKQYALMHHSTMMF